jgi:hypothetical protein
VSDAKLEITEALPSKATAQQQRGSLINNSLYMSMENAAMPYTVRHENFFHKKLFGASSGNSGM